jgi:Fe-S oxidoreductase
VKKRQLDETQATTVVTACSNCRHMLEDGIEQNDMKLEVTGITELLAKYLV